MSAFAAERDIEAEVDQPWPLPDGWAWAKLGELGGWTGGGTPSKSIEGYWQNGTVPWVSPKDMKFDVIRETEDRITADAVAASSTKYVAPGSILMVMRSGILRHTFPVAVNADRVTGNQDLRARRPRSTRFFSRIICAAFSAEFCTIAPKTVPPCRVFDTVALEKVWVPVAPESERRRIVARIVELFAEIAEGENALKQARFDLDIWRRALLKAAVTGELTRDWREANNPNETGADLINRVRSVTWKKASRKQNARREPQPLVSDQLPTIPTNWAWCRLQEIGDIIGGVTVDKKRSPEDPVDVPYLRVANVQRGFLDLKQVKVIRVKRNVADRLRLQSNDILLNEGGDRDKIGRGWIWEQQVPNCIHQNHVFRVRLHDPDINPIFVSHFANEMGRRFFIEKGKQTTNLASISMSKIGELPVPIPPAEEVKIILARINQHLAAEEDDRRDVDEASTLASTLRQSILKFAFEGRLVTQDPNDKPASAMLARLRAEAPSARRGRKIAR